MKGKLRSLAQILTLCVAIVSLVCAFLGMMSYLGALTRKTARYNEFPPEYDDYVDWENE